MIADGTLPAYRFRGQIRIAIEDLDKAMRPRPRPNTVDSYYMHIA
ncbi:hypothetical protein [Nocardia sp. NBC_01009]|nr:hypothetical protein OHA42_30385 [Nocardia sp. NBC_01009]